jgi:predicted TIM-barrel fold metal-dependent hydrolase
MGLSLFRPPSGLLADAVTGAARDRGPALRAPRLDAHAHVHSAAVADLVETKMGERILEPVSSDEVVSRLDQEGIPNALVLSGAYLMANDVWGGTGADEWSALRSENDYTAAEVANHPARLTAFLSLNPKRPYAIEEIDRCVDELGMRGVKMHFWNSVVNLRDADELAAVTRTFEHVARRGLPVVVHAYNGALPNYGPDDLETFVREIIVPLPTLRISFAHLAGAGGFGFRVISHWSRLLKLVPPDAPGSERVFVDLAAVLFARATERFAASNDSQKEIMGDLLTQWGLQRVLWGSDNVDDYLSLSRDAWPLSEEEWEVVAASTGDRFLQS